ncbi:unnamed protein product [Cuscuta epithymum]|uniref:Uncharacterized protein n=1 Tax=Cuscuta epithymum TaxID=186058 RepID=A0AAV0G5U3_9ASTE|nr:unnamed protein product [Cuscuta epithymum]CAH9143345.1 unnamed protein product [Cuscuta epithymum]
MHMMHFGAFRTRVRSWLRDYDRIQSAAVILIYLQIACALIGSLGAFYSGVLFVHLGISLFALVAIESSSQSLGRTYAVLLLSAVLLDVLWFILFSHEIWNISSKSYGASVIFSVKLTMYMQIIGFCVRLSSSILWIQIYRLGPSYVDLPVPRETDTDLQNSFLSPVNPAFTRPHSGSDDALGGSVYDPAYYFSLMEDGKDENYLSVLNQNHGMGIVGSTPSPERTASPKPVSNSVQGKDELTAVRNMLQF